MSYHVGLGHLLALQGPRTGTMLHRLPYVGYVFRRWLANGITATVLLSLIPQIPGLLAKSVAPSPGSTSSSELLHPPHTNSSSLFSKTPVNDWESFAYPISGTIQILRGRIFTSRHITPDSLRFMIEGGLFSTLREIAILGNTRLRDEDNPYTYRVPGCYFDFRSKTSGKQPMMTYGMLGDVFMALEQVLEKAQRNFETSFVLTDEDRVTWGHGQVLTKAP